MILMVTVVTSLVVYVVAIDKIQGSGSIWDIKHKKVTDADFIRKNCDVSFES